jgi:hypothetical protein
MTIQQTAHHLTQAANILLALSLFTFLMAFWIGLACFAAGILLHSVAHSLQDILFTPEAPSPSSLLA